MAGVDTAALTLAAFFTSALTAALGAGGGTILLALMLQVLPPASALPLHGVVQLGANTWRVWLFRRHFAWPLIVRFAVPMPFGVALGLWLFQGLSRETISILIGIAVVTALLLRQFGARRRQLPLWAFLPVGFATGALNMIVGVIAPILGVLVIRKELAKEDMVGTLAAFGFLGNVLKVAAFSLVGFNVIHHLPDVAGMIAATWLGGSTGKYLLHLMPQPVFLAIFKIVLAGLAAKLILIDGGLLG